MLIFDYSDYREYLEAWRRQLPKAGRGIVGKLAEHLRVSQVQVSQVLSGKKDLTLDQALLLGEFLALSETEKEFLLWLVVQSRSGSDKLSKFSASRIKSFQHKAKQVKSRIPADVALTESQRQTFYSNYRYSAIRLFCAIEEGKTIPEICAHFQLSLGRVTKIVGFLVSGGLLSEGKNGRFTLGAKRTFIERESPYFFRHLLNWRLLALQSIPETEDSDLVFTSPVSLSRKDYEKIRARILQMIQEISDTVRESPAELVVCWNMDWFELRP
jgi:uncharacterized protein (TIGR02147 family)